MTNPQLPPFDPYESLGMAPPDDYRMKASAAFYLGAAPTAETKRVSNVLLDLRPGALIVVAPRAIGGERKD